MNKKQKKYYKLVSYIICIIIILFVLFYKFFYFEINRLPESKIIYDINNIEIGEIPYKSNYRHRNFEFNEIPDFYKQSVILLEDKSFGYNLGISIKGLIRSFYNNFKAGKIIEGGSTISSQFVRNNLWLNENRDYKKKILEFLYAINLNLRFSKDDIFTMYANNLYFGYLNYGLKSASIYYFGKEVGNLTKAEILALITIQKNSSKYDPYRFRDNFNKRFKILTKTLNKNGIISFDELNDINNEKLNFLTYHSNNLPYIVDFFSSKYINNSSVLTTIDYNLTNIIEQIATNTVIELSWKNVKDYGIVILDRKTNELKVMIGGKNYNSSDGQVNSTLALRQPGSTIKPFTYLLASKFLNIKPDDTILDLPVLYKTKDNYSYEPKNYSTTFEGEVSVGEALAQSINIPAIKLLEQLKVDTLLSFLKKLKITSLNKSADHYGLALTLGDGEVNLYELTRAYTIFSNSGVLCDIKFIKNQNDNCINIIEGNYISLIGEVLTSRFLKIGGYPINSALDFEDMNVFFKTGTSRNFRDNWTIGFTNNYVIGVWTGNKDASNMKGVSGATGAGEIFGRIVRTLEKTGISKQENIKKIKKLDYLEITSPLNGQKYKFDKFLVSDKQKIKLEFSTNIIYDNYEWLLDGKKTSSDFLDLSLGNHKLELVLYKNGKISKSRIINYGVVGN